MSKELGQEIVVKFTDIILGDVSGKQEEPITQEYQLIDTSLGIYSASGQYSSYTPAYAFDNSLSTIWYIRSSNAWLQVQVAEPCRARRLMFYSSSYIPNAFSLLGSNDGVTWDTIYTGNGANVSGWQTFDFENEATYKYYRLAITSSWGSYLYVYEMQLYDLVYVGNEKAITVTGKQLLHVDGPLIEGDYQVSSVEAYTKEHKTLADLSTSTLMDVVIDDNVFKLGVQEGGEV